MCPCETSLPSTCPSFHALNPMVSLPVSLGLVRAPQVSVRPLPGFSASWRVWGGEGPPKDFGCHLGEMPPGALSLLRDRRGATFLSCSPLQPCRTWCDCGARCIARGSIVMRRNVPIEWLGETRWTVTVMMMIDDEMGVDWD